MKIKHVNKKQSEAVTRLREANLVPTDTLPQCGLVVSVEQHGAELVEAVYDLDQGGKLVQEVVLPQKDLITVQSKQ